VKTETSEVPGGLRLRPPTQTLDHGRFLQNRTSNNVAIMIQEERLSSLAVLNIEFDFEI